eukprot:1343619-Amorphochlora_amoeboformis.AAC.1
MGPSQMHTMDGEKIPVADIRRNQKPPKPTIPSESQTRVFYVEEKKKVLPYNWVPSEGFRSIHASRLRAYTCRAWVGSAISLALNKHETIMIAYQGKWEETTKLQHIVFETLQ